MARFSFLDHPVSRFEARLSPEWSTRFELLGNLSVLTLPGALLSMILGFGFLRGYLWATGTTLIIWLLCLAFRFDRLIEPRSRFLPPRPTRTRDGISKFFAVPVLVAYLAYWAVTGSY